MGVNQPQTTQHVVGGGGGGVIWLPIIQDISKIGKKEKMIHKYSKK